jgi:hypothetical protein
MTKTETFPFRIARDGAVYIGERMFHGRLSGQQIHAGYVWREGREWRNDQTCDRYKTQDAAANVLVAIVSKSWMFDR